MSKQEIRSDKGQIKEFIRANKMYITNGCSMNDSNKAMEIFSIDNKSLWSLIYEVRDEVTKEEGVSDKTNDKKTMFKSDIRNQREEKRALNHEKGEELIKKHKSRIDLEGGTWSQKVLAAKDEEFRRHGKTVEIENI